MLSVVQSLANPGRVKLEVLGRHMEDRLHRQWAAITVGGWEIPLALAHVLQQPEEVGVRRVVALRN